MIEKISGLLCLGWYANIEFSVEKSMVVNKGRAVVWFVQFLVPKKSITPRRQSSMASRYTVFVMQTLETYLPFRSTLVLAVVVPPGIVFSSC